MTMVMGYLPQIEQIYLQGLDTWWYETGVGRVQMQLEWYKNYFFENEYDQIMAISGTGECQRFRSKAKYPTYGWHSCQVGPN